MDPPRNYIGPDFKSLIETRKFLCAVCKQPKSFSEQDSKRCPNYCLICTTCARPDSCALCHAAFAR